MYLLIWYGYIVCRVDAVLRSCIALIYKSDSDICSEGTDILQRLAKAPKVVLTIFVRFIDCLLSVTGMTNIKDIKLGMKCVKIAGNSMTLISLDICLRRVRMAWILASAWPIEKSERERDRHSGPEIFKKVQAKNSWNQMNKKIFFREIAFLAL